MPAVTQAYRFALDPTPSQQRTLASHAGAARFAYNWGLHLVQERLEQRRVDSTAQVPWTLPDLRREWNQAKRQVAPGGPITPRRPTAAAWTGWLGR